MQPGPQQLQQLLQQHLPALPFAVDEDAVAGFVELIQLLAKWNKVYNLTSVRDMAQMVSVHILDSLVIQPYLCGESVLDVGCGAGLPGLPLALINPQKNFTLLDSNSKKTRFVQQAIAHLKLDNSMVVNNRVEQFQPGICYDTVVARAYSSIEHLLTGIRHLLKTGSCILAMKGTYPGQELEAIGEDVELQSVVPLQVPGLNAERHLVILKFSGDSCT